MPYKDPKKQKAYFDAYRAAHRTEHRLYDINRSTPEQRAKKKTYDAAPENKARKKIRRDTPEQKAKQKAYEALTFDRRKALWSTPERKAKQKAYYNSPEIGARIRAYLSARHRKQCPFIKKVCPVCSVSFLPKRSNKSRFCSVKCRSAMMTMRGVRKHYHPDLTEADIQELAYSTVITRALRPKEKK